MKKILYLFSFIALISFSSCTEGADYETYGGKGLEFVHFAKTSTSQLVKASTGTVYLTVGITTLSDEPRTFPVLVDAENSTAIAGRDFNLSQNSVTIPAGEYTAAVAVETLYDTMEQDEVVSLVLKLDTDLLSPLYGNSTTLKLTYSVAVTMDFVVGNWTETMYDRSGSVDGTGSVTITRTSDTTVDVYGLWDEDQTLTATIDFDADPVTITFAPGQVLSVYYVGTYGNIYYAAYTGTAADSTADIVGTIDALGIRIEDWCAYMPGYPGGYTWAYGYSLLER